MPHWLAIVFIVIIYSFVMAPIEKWIYRKISNKVFAYIATCLVASAILLALYFAAHLIGFYK